MGYSERATELFNQGYNCAQAVIGAFSDDLGMDLEEAMKLSSSFGSGMGGLREVCGAVSGMFMVAGLMYGYKGPGDTRTKSEHYKLIKALAGRFTEENYSIVCKELLGVSVGPESRINELKAKGTYKKRSCAELVGCAAEIMGEAVKKIESESKAG